MKIFCTGIHGSNRRNYIKKFEDYCKERGKTVKHLDVAHTMFDIGRSLDIPLSKEKILDLDDLALKFLRSAAFERIISQVGDEDITIIDSHANFLWKNDFRQAFDVSYLRRFNPDLYITIIDNPIKIHKKLEQNPQWKGKLNLGNVIHWQCVEELETKTAAQFAGKPFYLIPQGQPGSTLYELIFEPEKELTYLSAPITHLDAENMQKVDKFAKKLMEYKNVILPIFIGDAPLEWKLVVDNDTVNRDKKLVRQCREVVVYFPKIVHSSGVITEQITGFENNQKVYTIFPSPHYSPFTSYPSDYIFYSEDEFFKFLEEEKKLKDRR
ncbi:MAG: ATP-binding protein [Candidatus Parvarchaeota archaeon]|nr:ATP-binding protein [Candidatus Jingweiarchaeum tengchongense]MCW1298071.1 ATP-binding protein [Candidatus Jingweiarchaeum tengchongense]MCW1300129.1 ATP-binding protein [Candidatus Jingweiarchaeum tengchongense]MCW1309621.1 ATP-binding protein [Candidatus Jingweiarchaeum tengchongense]MCW1310891.1 ATP-binding protein [Candidatus Jingweiarchaeum tengchongense]